MRDTIMRAMIICAWLLRAITTFSQDNNLAPGDIVFVSYQSDRDLSHFSNGGSTNFKNRFSILVLRDGGIPGNTTLYITDVGWDSLANNFILNTGEGFISWQVPAGGVRQGTEIYFISTETGSTIFWNAYTAEQGNTVIGTVSSLNNGSIDLSISGDQLLIYQTGAPNGQPGGANHSIRRFITAIHANIESGLTTYRSWDGANPTGNSQSSVPAGLKTGETAFLLSPGPLPGGTSGATEPDNGKYHCVTNGVAFTARVMAAIIYNPVNWSYNNAAFAIGASSGKCGYLISESLLPVRLVSFSAQAKENAVHVKWQTSEEVEHDYFEIERSRDGRNYAPVHRIRGTNGNGLKDYAWIDEMNGDVRSARLLYRLKIVSITGDFEYSKTVAVPLAQKGFMITYLNPGKVTSRAEIGFYKTKSGNLVLAVMDMSGRMVRKEFLQASKGYSNYVLRDLERLQAGLYLIVIESEGSVVTCRFVK